MKKKIILCTLLCIFMLAALAGCASKTALTNNEFKTQAANHGYKVTDISDQYKAFGYIKSATVAQSKHGWQIEFYVLDNEAAAIKMFDTNQASFESEKGSTSTRSTVSVNNYATYALTTNGQYMYLCRIDTTLLYVKADATYKNDVSEFVDAIGY